MEFFNMPVHFSTTEFLIFVDKYDNHEIKFKYRFELPEVAELPLSASISETDRRVVGVVLEKDKPGVIKKIDPIPAMTPAITPVTSQSPGIIANLGAIFSANLGNSFLKDKKPEKPEKIYIPVAFFKAGKMTDFHYINNYIKTINLYSDHGIEFSDELEIAKSHYNNIRNQCKVQDSVTNFKVKTQIYDMVFV